MKEPIALALVIQHTASKGISVIPLTSKYTFEVRLKVPEKGPGKKVGPTIEVQPVADSAAQAVQLPVDSLTVVYGENGQGKTSLLLEICHAFTKSFFDSSVGVIWQATNGSIGLQRGSKLPRVRLAGPKTIEAFNPTSRVAGTVFYTTSPFESARRKELAIRGTLDVTPSFTEHSFSGTSLCIAVGALPQDIEFIRNAGVKLEIKRPDLGEAIRRFETVISMGGSGSSSRPRPPSDVVDQLRKIGRDLTPQTQLAFAIELHRTSLRGSKAARSLFLELTDKETPLVGSPALGRLINQRNKREGLLTSTALIVHSLKTLEAASGQIPRASRRFGPYAEMLNSIPPAPLLAIQEAESLGYLRWQFMKLSSGQLALLKLFSSIGAALEKLALEDAPSAIIVVDEGEMFMHPAWQRKYLHDLMNFIEYYAFAFQKIHLFLATHSLIVAGDTPPKRLFDVRSGQMRNGFALGPKDVLTEVYDVDEFSGEIAGAYYEEIVSFLRSNDLTKQREDAVLALIEEFASERLKAYLREEIVRRKERLNAQA